MKKNLIAMLVVLTAAVAVESSAAPADDAIKQVFVQLDRCLANGDAKCAAALFVDDATFSAAASGSKILKGKPQILKFLEESLAAAKGGVKQTRSVVNVRMIGEDRALIDASVAAAGAPKEGGADAPGGQYHDVALMVLKDGKWLCQDIRSYVAGASFEPKKESGSEPAKEPAPEAKKEAAPPAEKEPAEKKPAD